MEAYDMTQAADVAEYDAQTTEAPVVNPLTTYGPTTGGMIGQLPFTGWTPMLGGFGGSSSGTVYNNGITQNDAHIVRALRTPGGRRLRRLLRTLNGVAPGASATENRTRIQHQQGSPGGLQLMETVPYINRVTTAADVTMINALLDRTTVPNPYPVDVGGWGGGGMLKYKGIG